MNKSNSVNNVIFFIHLSDRKIVFPDNFDLQYSKNLMCIMFLPIGLKLSLNLH